jgi:hypothetical protein
LIGDLRIVVVEIGCLDGWSLDGRCARVKVLAVVEEELREDASVEAWEPEEGKGERRTSVPPGMS